MAVSETTTAEGLRLVRAFHAIDNKAARKALIAFAESYAALASAPTTAKPKATKKRVSKRAR